MGERMLTPDVLVIGGGATGAGLLRDLARRGLRCLLVDRSDFGTGTSGRYHGLLHSGGRYVSKDPSAARECIVENQVLRRIAAGCIEDTGGIFVATPDDPDDYVDAFPGACAAAGIDCDEIPVTETLRREPALSPAIRRAFRVPDAALEPWQLIEANLADARAHGADAWPYQRVVAIQRDGRRISGVTVRDERSGASTRVVPRMIASAAGAWAGQVAALAGVELMMSPGKGTMIVYNQRMTDTVVNRCHPPGDGDIMVPVHTVAILGTTEELVEDPDDDETSSDEVQALINEGEALFPALRRMRVLRAYTGVRPLYRDPAVQGPEASDDGRAISRSHIILDHEARDGVEGLISIVGGKLTTYRLMAEQAANAVCAKLGMSEPCTTAGEPLPGMGDSRAHWLGHRLAEHEDRGGGDADLICECEMVTHAMLERFLDRRGPCSIDDIRRGTRLGMGPCQGGFCTFRAAAIMAERAPDGHTDRAAPGGSASDPEGALSTFLNERSKGTRAVAWGRQLQELWMVTGIYVGVMGLEGSSSEHGGEATEDHGAVS